MLRMVPLPVPGRIGNGRSLATKPAGSYPRAPNSAVPTRTCVAPSITAVS